MPIIIKWNAVQKEEIVHYYDHCEADYRFLWDLNHSHAMHAGFWDAKTRTLRDALKRENEVLAEIVGVDQGERILDAGCGVGGSSIFLAKQYQCHVVGITLSEKQVQTARRKAEEEGVSHLASFERMDYCATRFANHSFDVVWGIESICHAPNKEDFIKEAARLLRPGGRLIVADGFALQDNYSAEKFSLMQRWLKGWGVASLETISCFKEGLKKHNFKEITFRNMTSHVWPSARRLYLYSLPAISLSKIGEWMRLRTKAQTENLHSARCQYLALKQGLWQYGVFYAEK